jgi:hypothetical protein
MLDSWHELLDLAGSGQDGRLRTGVRARLAELLEQAPRPAASEPYGRRLLYRSDVGEVMLAGWPREGRSAAHDHGDAAGLVLVLNGLFAETGYDFDGKRLHPRAQRLFRAFDVLRASAGIVHDMHAKEEGLTLHFYWPAIRVMRVYDPGRRATFLVSGEGGAWLPRSTELSSGHVVWDGPAARLR